MNNTCKWYKKIAQSGAWHAYVQATDEVEVRAMHDQEAAIFPHLAAQYPGAYQIEELPADFVSPAPLTEWEELSKHDR